MKQRKNAGSEPGNDTEIPSSMFISGLPACLNLDPDSRLTSIVKVIRLSSSPFFTENFRDKSMENFYFIGVDVSRRSWTSV